MNGEIKNKEIECAEIKEIIEKLSDDVRREALAILRGMHLADNVTNVSNDDNETA